jgi:hypothetical protein
MRFFFDFTSDEKVIFDYLGLEFTNPRGAIDFAQEKSQFLKSSRSQEWTGWSIEVCSPEGARLCILPIDDAVVAAAGQRPQLAWLH